ncbi:MULTISPECIES: hypothetical protein [unclassified Streptomyces]|uniref:hypothetical protein n=1 Tax=Streptomyces TaxID=1883 RepID=UPI002250FB3B|nr:MULTISPECIES: hypothetical protein [unclassified Streptomyces]WSW11166.1 hypothetical protein OG298_43705 [Streptomyces sp. NBC_01005]WTB61094.1 hypothetical protein OG832_49850 [Streptomyces sp. NBC_00826]WTD00674.1 hypothetical protein OH736_43710 [Streptomyces sp. NBC_01650]WTH96235.1 hypothetical protein OIC43_45375 [Streptomyces sp. NBC_00825]WTI04742.1 hypothetical protein OHA23_44265 [Streptomyces sp. NBC_00822]
MRRVATMLGTLAAAGMMAIALPGSASAAQGELIFGGGQVVENPSGCIDARIWPLVLHNRTNEYAMVYSGPNCTGDVLAVVPPGGRTVQEFGASVFIA